MIDLSKVGEHDVKLNAPPWRRRLTQPSEQLLQITRSEARPKLPSADQAGGGHCSIILTKRYKIFAANVCFLSARFSIMVDRPAGTDVQRLAKLQKDNGTGPLAGPLQNCLLSLW
jgi:hypothetical protein